MQSANRYDVPDNKTIICLFTPIIVIRKYVTYFINRLFILLFIFLIFFCRKISPFSKTLRQVTLIICSYYIHLVFKNIFCFH